MYYWKNIFKIISIFFVLLIAGCQNNISALYNKGFPSQVSWRILPFDNNTNMDLQTMQYVEKLMASLLSSKGINHITTANTVASIPDLSSDRMKKIVTGAGLTLTGEINEWFVDKENRPHIIMSIYIIDAFSGKRVWNKEERIVGAQGQTLTTALKNAAKLIMNQLPIINA